MSTKKKNSFHSFTGYCIRYVEQEGDGTGVIRGSYTYLDPNYKWQKVIWTSHCFLIEKAGKQNFCT